MVLLIALLKVQYLGFVCIPGLHWQAILALIAESLSCLQGLFWSRHRRLNFQGHEIAYSESALRVTNFCLFRLFRIVILAVSRALCFRLRMSHYG